MYTNHFWTLPVTYTPATRPIHSMIMLSGSSGFEMMILVCYVTGKNYHIGALVHKERLLQRGFKVEQVGRCVRKRRMFGQSFRVLTQGGNRSTSSLKRARNEKNVSFNVTHRQVSTFKGRYNPLL